MFAPTTTTTTPQARNREPIPKRKMEFDLESVEAPFWFDGNGLITAILSALSASFPPGEKEFVQSVMHFRDQVTDPVLREQMRGFARRKGTTPIITAWPTSGWTRRASPPRPSRRTWRTASKRSPRTESPRCG
jgi:hypothetical protein